MNSLVPISFNEQLLRTLSFSHLYEHLVSHLNIMLTIFNILFQNTNLSAFFSFMRAQLTQGSHPHRTLTLHYLGFTPRTLTL